jgi:hypothetical protein
MYEQKPSPRRAYLMGTIFAVICIGPFVFQFVAGLISSGAEPLEIVGTLSTILCTGLIAVGYFVLVMRKK